MTPEEYRALAERLGEFVRQWALVNDRTDLIYTVWFDNDAQPVDLSAADLSEASAALPALLDANEALTERNAFLAERAGERLRAIVSLTDEVAALRAQLADIEALRALSEAASPGEWRTWNDGHVGSPSAHIGGIFMPTTGSDFDRQMPDARFVAAAVNVIRSLLSVPAVPGQPGADEDGFGGDAPKPYLGPSLVVPAVPVDGAEK